MQHAHTCAHTLLYQLFSHSLRYICGVHMSSCRSKLLEFRQKFLQLVRNVGAVAMFDYFHCVFKDLWSSSQLVISLSACTYADTVMNSTCVFITHIFPFLFTLLSMTGLLPPCFTLGNGIPACPDKTMRNFSFMYIMYSGHAILLAQWIFWAFSVLLAT